MRTVYEGPSSPTTAHTLALSTEIYISKTAQTLLLAALAGLMVTGCQKEGGDAPAKTPDSKAAAASKAPAKKAAKAAASKAAPASAAAKAAPAAPAADYEISVDDAAKLVGQPNVVFWFAGNDAAYEKGHIKGSAHGFAHDMAYLDDIQKCGGLPMCAENAAKFLGERGVSNDTLVIAYEDGKGVNESGIWFFLKLYGHDKVKIMVGGTAEWAAKGHALETGKGAGPAAATFKPGTPRKEMLATMQDVEAGNALVLDARHKFEEFTGQAKKEGMKDATTHIQVKRGGHIPDAVFSPWTKYAGNKSGKAGKPLFKTPAKLQKTLKKLKKKGYAADKQVITYCHVGLGRGSFQYMGLKAAGHDNVKLYMGGWSEWGNSSKPVATK